MLIPVVTETIKKISIGIEAIKDSASFATVDKFCKPRDGSTLAGLPRMVPAKKRFFAWLVTIRRKRKSYIAARTTGISQQTFEVTIHFPEISELQSIITGEGMPNTSNAL